MQITQSMAMESVSFSPLGTGSPSPSIVLLPLSSLSLADNTLDVSFQLFLNQIRPRSYMLKELRIASIPSELLLPRQQSISVDRAATARSDQLAGAAFAARSFDRRTVVGRRRAEVFQQRSDCEPGESGTSLFSESVMGERRKR